MERGLEGQAAFQRLRRQREDEFLPDWIWSRRTEANFFKECLGANFSAGAN
jgi:hypothetical protein